jgi:hypothetical protein
MSESDPLGNHTRNPSKQPENDAKITRDNSPKLSTDRIKNKAVFSERWKGETLEESLQLRRMRRWRQLSIVQYLAPKDRTAKCYRTRIATLVQVQVTPQHNKAHYSGLMVCGKVWNCPVCASKITEKRKQELLSIDYKALGLGHLQKFMITVTLQHMLNDDLKALRKDLGVAWGKVFSGGWAQRFNKKYKVFGKVTAQESTYGIRHGHHPHKHILIWSELTAKELEAAKDEMQAEIAKRYKKILHGMGRYASPKYGVHVKTGADVLAEYLTKMGDESPKKIWSLEAEITKAPVKTSLKSDESYSPFELLEAYIDNQDRFAGKAFLEYMHGMHGARQLVWGKGTREKFNLGKEATDKELAEKGNDKMQLLALLTPEDWSKVLRNNARGLLLEVAKRNKFSELKAFLKRFDIDLKEPTNENYLELVSIKNSPQTPTGRP